MQKILITGTSTGFGTATAQLFLDKGWNVVATMRNIAANTLAPHERLTVLPLDVTDADSIAETTTAAGPIDALVNNAGVGMLNALEGSDIASIREMFETNIIGTIAMAKAVLPQMRERRAGVIVNVSSSVTLKPLPALAAYTATKAAVNGFTKSLALEAAEFGIRTHLVLPGAAPSTAFGKNAVTRMGMDIPEAYAAFVRDYMTSLQGATEVTEARDVAMAVWHAVTEPDAPMHHPAGADAETLWREISAS
ncbi:short-chain dehydrogenase/reductase [Brucella pseudogrignonensis]|uniref:SDR family oxidoreductase n=1 Tax=Brucella pseudogrignonensis TaxID=419475 RepID=UPI0007DAB201|nr:SDR family oxidoreductase [Brucella pseudogrignonensis]ANG98744.1 short-chain dehydrogenase/reductase [Brucella pseudogrignonensis]